MQYVAFNIVFMEIVIFSSVLVYRYITRIFCELVYFVLRQLYSVLNKIKFHENQTTFSL